MQYRHETGFGVNAAHAARLIVSETEKYEVSSPEHLERIIEAFIADDTTPEVKDANLAREARVRAKEQQILGRIKQTAGSAAMRGHAVEEARARGEKVNMPNWILDRLTGKFSPEVHALIKNPNMNDMLKSEPMATFLKLERRQDPKSPGNTLFAVDDESRAAGLMLHAARMQEVSLNPDADIHYSLDMEQTYNGSEREAFEALGFENMGLIHDNKAINGKLTTARYTAPASRVLEAINSEYPAIEIFR